MIVRVVNESMTVKGLRAEMKKMAANAAVLYTAAYVCAIAGWPMAAVICLATMIQAGSQIATMIPPSNVKTGAGILNTTTPSVMTGLG